MKYGNIFKVFSRNILPIMKLLQLLKRVANETNMAENGTEEFGFCDSTMNSSTSSDFGTRNDVLGFLFFVTEYMLCCTLMFVLYHIYCLEQKVEKCETTMSDMIVVERDVIYDEFEDELKKRIQPVKNDLNVLYKYMKKLKQYSENDDERIRSIEKQQRKKSNDNDDAHKRCDKLKKEIKKIKSKMSLESDT